MIKSRAVVLYPTLLIPLPEHFDASYTFNSVEKRINSCCCYNYYTLAICCFPLRELILKWRRVHISKQFFVCFANTQMFWSLSLHSFFFSFFNRSQVKILILHTFYSTVVTAMYDMRTLLPHLYKYTKVWFLKEFFFFSLKKKSRYWDCTKHVLGIRAWNTASGVKMFKLWWACQKIST